MMIPSDDMKVLRGLPAVCSRLRRRLALRLGTQTRLLPETLLLGAPPRPSLLLLVWFLSAQTETTWLDATSTSRAMANDSVAV